jgi:hypothetical protein
MALEYTCTHDPHRADPASCRLSGQAGALLVRPGGVGEYGSVGIRLGNPVCIFWGLIGEEPLRRFVRRFGRFVLLEESNLDKARKVFERYGGKAILIDRFIPSITTTFTSVLAGIKGMSSCTGCLWSSPSSTPPCRTLHSSVWVVSREPGNTPYSVTPHDRTKRRGN